MFSFSFFQHPNARWLFDPSNLIYLSVHEHKRFRLLLTSGLLGGPALEKYAAVQEKVVREHLSAAAAATTAAVDVRIAFRSMAAAASQEVFLGPHVATAEIASHLERDILLFTQGFLCFPIPWKWTGSGLSKAIEAAERMTVTVEAMVEPARKYVENGGDPRCVLEFFIQSDWQRSTEEGGDPTTHHDIALGIIDMLFAAQDATVSALCFAVDVLDGCEGGREAVNKVSYFLSC